VFVYLGVNHVDSSLISRCSLRLLSVYLSVGREREAEKKRKSLAMGQGPTESEKRIENGVGKKKKKKTEDHEIPRESHQQCPFPSDRVSPTENSCSTTL